MRNDQSVTLRVSRELLARTDALRKLLDRDPEVAGVYGSPSRATLLRLAILRGLEVLERKYAPGWELDETSVAAGDADGGAVADALPAEPGTDAAERAAMDQAFGVTIDPAAEFPTMFDDLGGREES